MKYFGEPWGAPVNENCERAETPVGEPCANCEKDIGIEDQGLLLPYLGPEPGSDPQYLPYHLDCFLKSVGVKP